MTEKQQKIVDNPLWWEHAKKNQQSIERWKKSPVSPEEALEQSKRLMSFGGFQNPNFKPF